MSSVEAAPGATAGSEGYAAPDPAPRRVDPPTRRSRRLRRHLTLVLAVVAITIVATLYVLTQVRTETKPISFTFATCAWTATSCAGNPSRGSLDSGLAGSPGADIGFGWFQVPSLAQVQGTWKVSGGSEVIGSIFFGSQAISINGSSRGYFAVAGPAPFTYAAAPPPVGEASANTWLVFDILSPTPVTITVTGTYFAPALPDGWTS